MLSGELATCLEMLEFFGSQGAPFGECSVYHREWLPLLNTAT